MHDHTVGAGSMVEDLMHIVREGILGMRALVQLDEQVTGLSDSTNGEWLVVDPLDLVPDMIFVPMPSRTAGVLQHFVYVAKREWLDVAGEV
jgi:hypothetical protein